MPRCKQCNRDWEASYPLEFEEVPVDWVTALYDNDLEGVFDFRQAYIVCGIDIIDLKF